MIIQNSVRDNTYYDSMTLLMISNRMAETVGTKNVAVMMGTDSNKGILERSGLLVEDGKAAGPNDLILAARGKDVEVIQKTFQRVEEYLKELSTRLNHEHDTIVKTFDSALQKLPHSNLAVISIPGAYAKRETMKAIDAGLHVLLFSDNVPIEDEIELKEKASSKGLLMMGPDCGTAIINGVALGFANVVTRGDIGIVAASGTGLQEVSTLIDKHGGGVSQAIGTGGRDIKEAVGGKMMLAGLHALANDASTKVIVLISKPPDRTVLDTILQHASQIAKPVVACFLGESLNASHAPHIWDAQTLEAAAHIAVDLSQGRKVHRPTWSPVEQEMRQLLAEESSRLVVSQKYIRALYTGGTLCYEALLIAEESLQEIYSNIPIRPDQRLPDLTCSQYHTFLDLGEDDFTRGRPHPMIEPALRNERLFRECEDPEVAVLLVDVVLGYGAHENPAQELAAVAMQMKQQAQSTGRALSIVASVCGASGDPQGFDQQVHILRDAGILVMPSNAQAVKTAIFIAEHGKNSEEG